MSIKAYRKGVWAKNWSSKPMSEHLSHAKGAIQFSFVMRYGMGDSESKLEVTSDSFEELAKEMMAADRYAAIRAFGAALASVEEPAPMLALPPPAPELA